MMWKKEETWMKVDLGAEFGKSGVPGQEPTARPRILMTACPSAHSGSSLVGRCVPDGFWSLCAQEREGTEDSHE